MLRAPEDVTMDQGNRELISWDINDIKMPKDRNEMFLNVNRLQMAGRWLQGSQLQSFFAPMFVAGTGKSCPNCNGPLKLIPCRGHGGYPVTNFWRHEGSFIFFQSKGAHDHPRPETKSEAEARRSIQKAHTMAVPPISPRLKRTKDPESLTSEMQSQDMLPLVISKQEDFVSHSCFPEHFRDRLPQERMLNNSLSLAKGYSFGKSSYLIEHPQDTGCDTYSGKCKQMGSREYDSRGLEAPAFAYSDDREQAWNKNMDLGKNPPTDKYCNGSTAILAGLHCETLASINTVDFGIQHALNIPPTVKVGYHPLRSNVGMFGEETCEGKAHLNYSSSVPSAFCQLSPEESCFIEDATPHYYQNALPMKGNEWHIEDERKYLNLDHCHNEMFFNLFPLR
ncbi:hypothetical protein lerEdw1_001361 [Lerista edwardsae]|nr:hypothetical protein lerEdw1_001361 [Lerista edwardsae]